MPRGKRIRDAGDDWRRQDAHRDEVLAPVVMDRDRFVRRRAFAFEAHHLHGRILGAPMAGAELRHRRRHRDRRGRAERGLCGFVARCRRFGALAAVLLVGCGRAGGRCFRGRIATTFRRDSAGAILPRDRLRPFAEHGDADDADVFGAAGARGVGVGQLGEIERGGTGEALAPALDVGALVRVQHIPRLRRRCGVAGDHVDAVDAHHREDAAGGRVAVADRILLAGRADDPIAPALVVDRQRLPVAASDDFEIAEAADRRDGAGGQRERREYRQH